MTCTQRSLNILDAMIRNMEAGQRIEISDVKVFLTLLTALAQRNDEQLLIARIEEALRFRKGRDFVRNCCELSGLLKSYLTKEQDAVAARLSPEVSLSLSRLERKYAPQLKEKTAHHFFSSSI